MWLSLNGQLLDLWNVKQTNSQCVRNRTVEGATPAVNACSNVCKKIILEC